MRSARLAQLSLSAAILVSACGDDGALREDTASPVDAGKPTSDASGDKPDAARADAATSRDGGTGDAAQPKAACTLLPAAEVAAVLGTPQSAKDDLHGRHCVYASLDPDKKDVRGLLEVVTDGRAIYQGNLQMYADANVTPVPVSGVGDQAAFISESVVRSSLMCTVGDVLLRLNLGWGEPGAASQAQLAGERTLMQSAIGRL